MTSRWCPLGVGGALRGAHPFGVGGACCNCCPTKHFPPRCRPRSRCFEMLLPTTWTLFHPPFWEAARPIVAMGLPVPFYHGPSFRAPPDLVIICRLPSADRCMRSLRRKKPVSYWGRHPPVSSWSPKGTGVIVHSPGRQKRTHTATSCGGLRERVGFADGDGYGKKSRHSTSSGTTGV